MPDYRFYVIQNDGHIIEPPSQIRLLDDDAATKEAERLLDDLDIEIWQGARVVAHLIAARK